MEDGKRGQQRMRWLDDIINSMDVMWVWANSGRWRKTGKPGVLQSTELQRVKTQLNDGRAATVQALGGPGATLTPVLPLARTETTIACVQVGRRRTSSVPSNPTGPDPASGQGLHTREKWNQLRSAAQALGPATSHPQPRQRLPSRVGKAQLLQGSCCSFVGPSPSADRSSTATEPRRKPGLHLNLTLVSDPTLSPTKAVAASTLLGKTRTMPASGLVLPSKPLGVCGLHRDASIQGCPFKIRISNLIAPHFIETNIES